MTSIENLRRIDYFAYQIALEFKDESKKDIEEALEQLNERVLEQICFTKEELKEMMEKQLETLAKKLSRLVSLKKIEESTAKEILSDLNRGKKEALRKASETPIRNNSNARCLPVMPVIGTNALDVSLLMELIEGENFIPLEKIKTFYPFGRPKKTYWVIDVRINEFNANFSPVLIEEAIAYCLHSNILLRHRVLITNSRYWHAMNNWEFMIVLMGKKPIFCRTSDYEVSMPACKPICFFPLIF